MTSLQIMPSPIAYSDLVAKADAETTAKRTEVTNKLRALFNSTYLLCTIRDRRMTLHTDTGVGQLLKDTIAEMGLSEDIKFIPVHFETAMGKKFRTQYRFFPIRHAQKYGAEFRGDVYVSHTLPITGLRQKEPQKLRIHGIQVI